MDAVDRSGELHGLVCAAGVLGPVGRLDEVSIAALSETVAINLFGTLLALRFALPRLGTLGRARSSVFRWRSHGPATPL